MVNLTTSLQLLAKSTTITSCLFCLLAVPELAGGEDRPAADNPKCRIVVGRNVQITDHRSQQGVYSWEPRISVNPKNRSNILVGHTAINPMIASHAKGGGRTTPEVYVSEDGGRTWESSQITGEAAKGFAGVEAAHTIVLFNADGDALLTFEADVEGDGKTHSIVAWSLDGGRSFTMSGRLGVESANFKGLGKLRGFDGASAAVADLTTGRFRGQIYIPSLTGYRDSDLVTISRGDRSWYSARLAGPDKIDQGQPHPHRTSIVQPIHTPALIDKNGTVIVPVVSYQSERYSPKKSYSMAMSWLVSSSDGGVTFAQPRPVVTESGKPLTGNSSLNATYAIDPSFGPYGDSIYRAWASFVIPHAELNERLGWKLKAGWQLQFAKSTDAGKTWSDAVPLEVLQDPSEVITAGSYGDAPQTLPVVTVSSRGVLLITWYRFFPGSNGIDGKPTINHRRFVSASLDGGQTFLPAQPLASALTTDFRPSGNGLRAGFPPNPETNGDLGHYMNVDSDPSGTFHAAWLDGRTGKQELWYAPISVRCGGKIARAK
jgi:hypothetical protein